MRSAMCSYLLLTVPQDQVEVLSGSVGLYVHTGSVTLAETRSADNAWLSTEGLCWLVMRHLLLGQSCRCCTHCMASALRKQSEVDER